MANTKPSGMDVHDFCCNASNGSVSINQLSERKKKEIKELKITNTNNKQQTTNKKKEPVRKQPTPKQNNNKQHNKQTTNNTTNNKSKSRTRTYLE